MASEIGAARLVRDIKKLATFVDRGLITAREYIASVMDALGWVDCRPPIVPALWDSIPAAQRENFAQAMRDTLKPDFQWEVRYICGPNRTAIERSRENAQATARIRAWAIEFLRYLDGDDEELRDSLAAIEQGIADAESGLTRPFREVLDEIRNGRTDDAADDTDRWLSRALGLAYTTAELHCFSGGVTEAPSLFCNQLLLRALVSLCEKRLA